MNLDSDRFSSSDQSPQKRIPQDSKLPSVIRPLTSLQQRRSPLSDPQVQLKQLEQVNLQHLPQNADFAQTLAQNGYTSLQPRAIEILQLNIGKLCNMTCRHCHVDAGPDRTQENMDRQTIDDCLELLDQTQAETVDITGGAPELNPHFRYLVDQCVQRGKQVIDRCNLTVLLLPPLADLPQWFADRGVEIVCSLPHYRSFNTDKQRGNGTFAQSLEALKRLNAVGYGQGDPQRQLTLVTNPIGAILAGNQSRAEQEWKDALWSRYQIRFDRLISLNNMPISRFLEWLEESGNLAGYLERLVNAFNPGTIEGLMCRHTLSVSWDGCIYDCDFNQMLDLKAQYPSGEPLHIRDFRLDPALQRKILTSRHCFGCTAGAGSSCGGAIQPPSQP
ncbi:MAG: arsenosugar biosynthesis radical SAM (seleno)protein ArsS [Prochlorotrichaceae cyanobacterium]|jgi:radical SAM/Cys-rich protein